MEVPHFEIEKCQIWLRPVSRMYHFNSMPFHELGVAITFQLKAISENEDNNIFSILCHLRMGSASISIWCNFRELRRRRYHSQISCTFSAAAGAIIWYAVAATNRMKRKMHGERPWGFCLSLNDSTLNVWVDSTYCCTQRDLENPLTHPPPPSPPNQVPRITWNF